ncbi:hypothetical protein LTR85_005312 [Meristemomyces frigidus]|nr:hypothetical protein LTR85_005312 [Meristemomyces frigidus]
MDGSPLARLPAELRNYIYELCYTQRDSIRFSTRSRSPTLHRLSPMPRHTLALSHTCKQSHGESAKLFYGCNAFRIEMVDGELCSAAYESGKVEHNILTGFRGFLGGIGPANADALSSVTIDLAFLPVWALVKPRVPAVVSDVLRELAYKPRAKPQWHLHVALRPGCFRKVIAADFDCSDTAHALRSLLEHLEEAAKNPTCSSLRHVEDLVVVAEVVKRWVEDAATF